MWLEKWVRPKKRVFGENQDVNHSFRLFFFVLLPRKYFVLLDGSIPKNFVLLKLFFGMLSS